MSKLRVHELAKELNIETKVIMQKLKTMGVKVASHQSTLTDEQVAALKSAFGGGNGSGASPSTGGPAQAAAPASDAGKPRVVIRRRASEASHPSSDGDEMPTAMAPADEVEAPVEAAPAPAPKPVVAEKPAAPVIASAPAPVAAPPAPVTPAAPVSAGASVIRPAPRAPEAAPSAIEVSAPAPRAPETRTQPDAASRSTVSPSPAREPAPQASAASLAGSAGASRAPVPAPASRAPNPAPPMRASPQAAAAPSEDGPGDAMRRRREAGGATIVRRATPEEVANAEQNRQRQTGRKEDHRGTRVTGLGLLTNRISNEGQDRGATGGPPGTAGTAGLEDDAWGARRGAAATASRDGKKPTAAEEAEEAKKKAAAKNRRAHGALSTRALLEKANELNEDLNAPLDYDAPDADDKRTQEAIAQRTVYTPQAPRGRRDLKRRKDLRKTQVTTPRAGYRVVEMEESITVGELAHQMSVKAGEIIKKLMAQGIMATINQEIDADTAGLMANEFGFELKNTIITDDDVIKEATGEGAEAGNEEWRPPIVTVMGHVDHGKTSILDAIRQANVAGGEAGGITQHIGAYSVDHNGRTITFLDTPGHEAFSSMRARGAKVTDIVILVVAADDGVMPQTIEAINHAKAANVPIIVAVNKVDKHNINFDRVYTELTEHGIQAEEWGGEVQFIKVSALKRTGITELLEAVLLQAEVLDLKARPDGPAEGTVIEGHLDKGRGPVATVVVQVGTLEVGNYIVAGTEIGRVRAMHDYNGKNVLSAGPSIPVEIIGLSGVPRAGDTFNIVADERSAREVIDYRVTKVRNATIAKSSAASLADLLARVKNQEIPEVAFILKGDTQGSVEAISESILKLNTDRVKNKIIHHAVGGITESDISLASSSGAVVIGFNVRAGRGLDDFAERQGVVIKYFSIIYEIVDTVKALMVGKLPPIISEAVIGHAEVRKPISVPKIGTIAGSAVLDGKITRGALCRLIRESVVIYSGKLGSLRRFKDDVKEVAMGYECGIGIDGYNDVREGDVIEAFVLEETAATL